MSINLKEMLRGFNEAVNETALAKSDFYRHVISEIKATVSRKRPRLNSKGETITYEVAVILNDLDGNPIKNEKGEIQTQKIEVPVMETVSLDDMITGIYSLGSRGSKIHRVPDAFIRRIARETTAARILGNSGYKCHSEHLQELARQDIEVVVKIILPDLTRVSMPAHMKLAETAGRSELDNFNREYSPTSNIDLTKQQGVE